MDDEQPAEAPADTEPETQQLALTDEDTEIADQDSEPGDEVFDSDGEQSEHEDGPEEQTEILASELTSEPTESLDLLVSDDDGGPDTEEIVVPVAPITTAPVALILPSPVWMWWGWSMVGLLVAVVGVGVLTGILGRAVVLDIISFWPIFGLLGLLAFAVRSRFSHRIRAILPMLITTWLAVAIALHLSGWVVLPSATGDMTGVDVGTTSNASLALEIDGMLNIVGTSGGALYSVDLPREGGRVSAPQALETATDDLIVIELAERSRSFWFSSSGWNVALAETVGWELDLSAPEMLVDLSDVSFRGGSFVGGGEILLGEVSQDVALSGEFNVRLPDGIGVLVIGNAELPTGWLVAEEGMKSADEVVLTITVAEGSTVKIELY